MPLTTIELETAPNPRATVLLMHGLGADGNDFVPISKELDLNGVGPVRFVFPNAPQIPVTINGGMRMPAWYDIVGADLAKREDEAGLRASRDAIELLLAREKERGIPAERIVIAGFSQGCAMALLTGLRHAERLAGVLALSTYLPLSKTLEKERSAANRDLPIFMAHGKFDGMIPMDRAALSRDALKSLGYAVDWREYPMQHSVCPEEIADIAAFLLRIL